MNATMDKPTWDEYAHIYIQGLNDYMDKAEIQEFTTIERTRIYKFGRFLGAAKPLICDGRER
jgi:hypothetical protein